MKLSQGIYIYIDDEFAEEDSIANKFFATFKTNNLLCFAYKHIDEVHIDQIKNNMSNIAMVIMDWYFWETEENIRLKNGDEKDRLKYDKIRRDGIAKNKKFVNSLAGLNIPLVIFTTDDSEIETMLGYEIKDKPLLYLTQKQDNLNRILNDWYKQIPNLMIWNRIQATIEDTISAFKSEIIDSNSSWLRTLWETHCTDNGITDVHKYYDVTEPLLRNVSMDLANTIISTIFNRMPEVEAFSESEYLEVFKKLILPTTKDELHQILTNVTFVPIDKKSKQHFRTGDVFMGKDEGYYINIRAVCDTARSEKPELYLLKAKLIENSEYTKESGYIGKGGAFQTRTTKMVVPFIKGKHLEVEFSTLVISIADKNKNKVTKNICRGAVRIGRILPPYITLLKGKYAQYMTREGIMPIPALFHK